MSPSGTARLADMFLIVFGQQRRSMAQIHKLIQVGDLMVINDEKREFIAASTVCMGIVENMFPNIYIRKSSNFPYGANWTLQ